MTLTQKSEEDNSMPLEKNQWDVRDKFLNRHVPDTAKVTNALNRCNRKNRRCLDKCILNWFNAKRKKKRAGRILNHAGHADIQQGLVVLALDLPSKKTNIPSVTVNLRSLWL